LSINCNLFNRGIRLVAVYNTLKEMGILYSYGFECFFRAD